MATENTKAVQSIGIVGSGLIGRNFAMLFASGGYEIQVFDIDKKQVTAALEDIKYQLMLLEKTGLLKGKLTAAEQFERIKGTQSLKDCVANAIHVQECVPEDLQLKIKVFSEIDSLVGPNTVISSSTSCIVPSKFTQHLTNRSNCLVSHPINPPYYVPLVEVVPAPWTSKDVVIRTCNLLKEIHLSPVMFSKEIPGFALNRIQYAILNECYHLVNEEILSAKDVDTVMTDGLAMRYVWSGPLETAHLNAEGLDNYLDRFGSTIYSVCQTFKPIPSWKRDDAKAISAEMEKIIPLDQLKDRRKLREARLIALAQLKKDTKLKQD